jgi:pyrroloquinoline-quinone synthase
LSASVWERIEMARERWNVLRHPFYRRWSAGELGADELGLYSGQYRHAVEAIATMSRAVATAHPDRPELQGHADEERDHVRLWDDFVEATGGSTGAAPIPETAACVAEWTGDGDQLTTLVRLYAIESGQPEISRTKRDGLVSHYGFEDGQATAYFRLHEELDVEHAGEGRALIDELRGTTGDDELVAAAEGALRANWRLLDGV